jgi:DNA polymerase
MTETKTEQLNAIKSTCDRCFDCELGKTRTNIVFSAGNPEAKIMLIGEAPGQNEDETGFPFVGRAGKLLDELFKSQNLTRENDIYICNTVKCRPPKNRVPSEFEKAQCRKYLDAQIAIIKPQIILLCGATALKSLMSDNKLPISKIRGQWFVHPSGAKLMPIFHPSYLLRNPIAKEGSPKWLMLEDIKTIKEYYSQI